MDTAEQFTPPSPSLNSEPVPSTEPTLYDRRQILQIGGLVGSAIALAACRNSGPSFVAREIARGIGNGSSDLDPHPPSPDNLSFSLGAERPVSLDLPWAPDGHVSYLRSEQGVRKLWVAAGPRTHYVELSDNSLEKPVVYPTPSLEPSYAETPHGFNGYSGFGSVLPSPTGSEHYIGLYHNEYWASGAQHFPFNAEIGFAVSTDGGITWEKKGNILPSNQEIGRPGDKGERVIGAGQPSAIIRNVDGRDYAYMYYVDWSTEAPDAIHLARSPLDSIGDPNSWEKFSGSEFGPAASTKSTGIIQPRDNEAYAALPSISYNAALGKFLAIYETGVGFNMATSDDGLTWSGHQRITDFPTAHDERNAGDTWYSYPTFLTLDTDSHTETGLSGLLIHSRGTWMQSPHQMVARELTLQP